MSVLACTVLEPISELDISGRRQELDEANVAAILAGLLDGQETPPIGIDEQGRVLWGFHRLEAHARAGRDTIRCDVYRFPSPEAQEAAVISENLRRRHLDRAERDRLLARYVELIGKQREAQSAIDGQNVQQPETRVNEPRPGRKESPRRRDIKTAAQETGYNEKLVERAVKAQEEPDEPEAPPEPPPPCIVTFGVPVAPEVLARAAAIQAVIDRAEGPLRLLATLCGQLEGAGVPTGTAQRISKTRDELMRDLKAERPEWICIYCKARPDLMPHCVGCKGDGLTLHGQAKDPYAKELEREGAEAMVCVGGEYQPYHRPPALLKAPRGKGKKLKVTLPTPDGGERTVTREELGLPPPDEAPPPSDDDEFWR